MSTVTLPDRTEGSAVDPYGDINYSVINYGDIVAPGGRRLWAAHWRRVAADPGLDPEVKRWELDPTLWTIADSAAQLGWVNSQRIWILRNPTHAARRPMPHPHRFVWDVGNDGGVYDRQRPLFAAGMVRRWAQQTGRTVTDRRNGDLIPGVIVVTDDGHITIRRRRAE